MLRRCACVRANLRALLKTEKREASAAWMVVLSLLETAQSILRFGIHPVLLRWSHTNTSVFVSLYRLGYLF